MMRLTSMEIFQILRIQIKIYASVIEENTEILFLLTFRNAYNGRRAFDESSRLIQRAFSFIFKKLYLYSISPTQNSFIFKIKKNLFTHLALSIDENSFRPFTSIKRWHLYMFYLVSKWLKFIKIEIVAKTVHKKPVTVCPA